MTRCASFILVLLCAPLVHGAPLVTGLGGDPRDLGEPVRATFSVPIDLRRLGVPGLRFYGHPLFEEIHFNWPGSLSFELGLCCHYREQFEMPSEPNEGGLLLPPRIVPYAALGSGSNFDPSEPDHPLVMFFGFQPIGPERSRLVTTWYDVPDVRPAFDQRFNTWQAIITPVGDDGDFDLELRYHRCEWYRLEDFAASLPAVMGFDAGRGQIPGGGWMWPGSQSEDMLSLCELSNVREPGVFRYAFRDGQPTGCGIDVEPPPGEDRCADGNHLPGDGCSPACYREPDVDGDGRREAPSPDSVDPFGAYDDCFDPEDPACDDDRDDDGVADQFDNCPDTPNPDQHNYDLKPEGDACEIDADNDGLYHPFDIEVTPFGQPDLCPLLYNPGARIIDPDIFIGFDTSDPDRDGLGDQCDPDDDGDGVIDCGTDGICNELDNGADDDRDNAIDEGGECVPGDEFAARCEQGDRDLQDNDGDGYIDEIDEEDLPRIWWPGPDPDGSEDNCRQVPNPEQYDQDGDGIGDACDLDLDGDGIDNCAGGLCGPPYDGRDNDRDGLIDEPGECATACDPASDLADQDLDGYVDEDFELSGEIVPFPPKLDNCPLLANPDQADANGDGVGDLCADDDRDGHDGHEDNCIEVPNPEQADLDGDGQGDVCDPDDDGDGVPDATDRCPRLADDQADLDADGLGDACDPDDDEDGINDPFDGCPRDFDPDQADLDGDGVGDVCDPDVDGDGALDLDDGCPRIADDQTDTDADGEGDACDADDDGDGVDDVGDVCPLIADPLQLDLDDDGLGDACDPTDDRPFERLTPDEQCDQLLAERASTASRVAICPAEVTESCRVAPGRDVPRPWWLLGVLVATRLRSRRRRPG